MKVFQSAVWCGAALLVAVAACEPAERERAEQAPPGVDPAAGPAVPVDPLSPERIGELAAMYPVLREEPAPPPQPNGDADPNDIPERVQRALPEPVLEEVTGGATFYANKFEGRRTASGIPFRQNQLVAAHRAYPFGTVLRVTNLANDRSVNVRVVDRGPFGGDANKRRTVIDLSRRAAQQLGFIDAGRTQVRVEVLEWGNGVGT
jgi:rare lipoprotein A